MKTREYVLISVNDQDENYHLNHVLFTGILKWYITPQQALKIQLHHEHTPRSKTWRNCTFGATPWRPYESEMDRYEFP
jgi:hypothetical protein